MSIKSSNNFIINSKLMCLIKKIIIKINKKTQCFLQSLKLRNRFQLSFSQHEFYFLFHSGFYPNNKYSTN